MWTWRLNVVDPEVQSSHSTLEAEVERTILTTSIG